MAALGKRRSADEHEGTLDRWGQLYITDAELAKAQRTVDLANVTPIWALCMLDAGLVAPGYEDNAADVVRANHIVQHAKRQREDLDRKRREDEQAEKEEAAQKKQKIEQGSDSECDCGICECERRGMATASMCQKKMMELDEVVKGGDTAYDPTEPAKEENGKPCASEQKKNLKTEALK